MDWIILSEHKIKKDDISALVYRSESELSEAALLIYLRGGSEIKLGGEDAATVWEAIGENQSSDGLF